jgi:hypothetical protein
MDDAPCRSPAARNADHATFGVEIQPISTIVHRHGFHIRDLDDRSQHMTLYDGGRFLMFAPFLVAIILITFGMTSSATGLGPANNSFSTAAVIAIAIGLLLAIVSLLLAKPVGIGWRVLIAILYVPTVIFSMLAAGL